MSDNLPSPNDFDARDENDPGENISLENVTGADVAAESAATDSAVAGSAATSGPSVDEIAERLARLWSSGSEASNSGSNTQGDSTTGFPSSVIDFQDLAGKRVGPYQLQRILGRGAFGVVYLAKDDQLEREVALKLARPEVLLDDERLRRFRSEAAMAALLEHPFIVPVYGAEFSGPAPYIVSAYCAGPDLGKWLSQHSETLDCDTVARFLIRLATAVEYAHQQGVMHRDLKPGNVLLEAIDSKTPQRTEARSLDEFNPRLTDFGLAKLIQASVNETRSSLLVGTPLYMAPEQLLDDSQQESEATDVYAIGILLFELLTRKTPREELGYVEGLDQLRNEDAPSVQTLRPDVPDALATIIAKCLERDPEDRYPSAGALAAELQRFVDGIPILAKPVNLKGRFHRWMQEPQRLAFAGYFTVWFQALTVTWLTFALMMMTSLSLFPDGNFHRYFGEVLKATVIGPLPTVVLGWRLLKGKRWSYWPSVLGSVVQLAVFIYSTINDSVVFEYVHPTQLSKLNAFSVLITCAVLQLTLHLLALPAWLKLRRKQSGLSKKNTPQASA